MSGTLRRKCLFWNQSSKAATRLTVQQTLTSYIRPIKTYLSPATVPETSNIAYFSYHQKKVYSILVLGQKPFSVNKRKTVTHIRLRDYDKLF